MSAPNFSEGVRKRAPLRGLFLGTCLAALSACTSAPSINQPADAACQQNARVSSVDGVELRADCYPGRGPAVVFIHGWSQSRVVWTPQIAAMLGERKLVSYDLRGHGESDRPVSEQAFLGKEVPSRDLESVLDHFGIAEAVLVGWSFGASVATESAAILGSDRVVGLVLVSGSIESASPRNAKNFGPLASLVGAMTQDMTQDDRKTEELAAVEQFLKDSYIAGEWDPALYQRVLDANMSLTPAERRRVSQRPPGYFAAVLNDLKLPVLLIHGENDNVFSMQSSIAAHAELDHSTLHIYEDTGHWPFLERPVLFSEHLRALLRRFAD